MDHIWKTIGILGFEIGLLDLCNSHPIPYHKDALEAELPGALLGVAMLLVSVVCIIACVCCRENRRKGFKEFRDSTHSIHQTGLSFSNPGLGPVSELAIFPPPGATPVTFEPLPSTLSPPGARKPPALRSLHSGALVDHDDWFGNKDLDFPRQQLQYLQECGRGWFGRVVEGEALGLGDTRQKVMVRILREDATSAEQRFFLAEAKPYRDLDHQNVLKLVGRCLETNPYLVLLEACSAGDLKSFLCGNLTSSNVLCEQAVCLSIMCQVAAGLRHMILNGFVHTDLAARNCQVTSDLTVKVGDYGTSIDTYKDEYYIAGDVAVPVRWCAPESLHCTDTTIETKQVTAEANVWSLGILLWEVCQFGQMPYTDLSDDQVIVRVLGNECLRLPPPTLHPLHASALYSLMCMCWRPSGSRASLDHVLNMLNHLHTTHSEEDFQRRWDALKPNTTPEITLETMTARSDFDSGVDLEIKSTDREILELVKKSSSDINMSPSTVSPQLSVTSSSGGEFFSQSSLPVMKKQQSPSMTNLHGSVEDVSKTVEEEKKESEDEIVEFDSWLKGVETTNEEDVKFVKKISEAIKDLDDALALEKTSSSSDDSSRQESPLKETNTQDENPVLDFRLGPLNETKTNIKITVQPDSLQDDSLLRRDSSGTDTEDETWRGRIERGEFSEKVKEKSKSVTDLMILTHIESEGSESDSLPSLTRQYSVEKTKRKCSGAMMSTIGFGSEGNIRGAVLGEEFQDALKQLQAEWKLRDMESRENSLQFIKNEAQTSQRQEQLDFLSNDASETLSINQSPVTRTLPVNEHIEPRTSSSQFIDEKAVTNSLQTCALSFKPRLDLFSNSEKINNIEVKDNVIKTDEETSLKPLNQNTETTDGSDASQNTSSSSEISTPTQYEVLTTLNHVKSFIENEKEHSSSLTNKLIENLETITKNNQDSKEVDLIVTNIEYVVPNSNFEENLPKIVKEDTETICDNTICPHTNPHVNVVENECLNVNNCKSQEIRPNTIGNRKQDVEFDSPLLSTCATQNESNFQSDTSVVKLGECGSTKTDQPAALPLTDSKVPFKAPDFLFQSDGNDLSSFLPEIVVTEASILDIESDPEPEIVLPKTTRTRRNIRIVMSSSDESDSEDDKMYEEISISESEIFSGKSIVTSTPFLKEKVTSENDESVSEVDPTYPESTKSDSFFMPVKKENEPTPIIPEETSVILGSCEDYTLDYFKGLKTTFGKQTSDESTDEFSKSEGEEDEKKGTSMNNWDEFLTSALHQRYQDHPINSDVEFDTSDNDLEFNDKTREENITNLSDFNVDSVDILQPKIKLPEHFNDEMRKNVLICDRLDIFDISDKQKYENCDQQMQEIKNRLEDVAMLSESFCLKNQSMTMDDDEDGKLLTPDDERSSDSGFRDKGSLSESVEDACDEKYNLEDIDAELEEYSKHQDGRNSSELQDSKIDVIELNNDKSEQINNQTYVVGEDKAISSDVQTSSNTESDFSAVNIQGTVDLSEFTNEEDKQDRLNKLDSALNSDIDHYFETSSQTKTGWYLHPPPGMSVGDSQPVGSGWLPTAPEESKDGSYRSFEIDEEFVTAIRNELREKLPCAQNPEKVDNEEDISPEEERTDMVIQYNTFPVPLSPIFEERESISSNQSSLLLDDCGKSIESSGKSSPILYLDVTKEDDNLSRFEDDIRNALDVCNSESTESDNVLVTVEDLENSIEIKAQKMIENTKDDLDDLLVVDTETNKVTLYESPRPRSQLAFVKQAADAIDDTSSANSDTHSFYNSADDNLLSVDRNNFIYTPDSVSPLSSNSSRTGAAVSFSSSETGGSLSGFYLSPSSVRSDLLDNGPSSLPFDLGQMYEPVEEIKPNNEAEEIVLELVEAGMIKATDLKEGSETSDLLTGGVTESNYTSEEISQSADTDVSEGKESGSSIGTAQNGETTDSSESNCLSTLTNGNLNCNALQICSIIPPKNNGINKASEEISPKNQLQLTADGCLEYKVSNQEWLKSVLLSGSSSLPETSDFRKTEGVLVCLNNGWPSSEELLPQPIPEVKCESQVTITTPDSPSMDLLEIAAKFYDVNSTLAISTPNNISFDESKDNSQLSSFTSTPTLETAKCVTSSSKSNDKLVLTEKNTSQFIKKVESVPSLSSLASKVVLRFPANEERKVPSQDSSPDDSDRATRLQGMTLALEPSLFSKAPMPSPEDADKGSWRPTMGQLMELTNQPEQDDMMTTSFIDTDTTDYAPDWESDTSDDSEDHSSSSGEFIWRPQEGVSESSMARISEEEGEEMEDEDNSSCGSATEFIPSTWDRLATPTKSALRSSEKEKGIKRNVSFKREKYHCVYEYPRELSDSDEEERIMQRPCWQSPSTFDYSTYADWEYGEGEVEEPESDSDDNNGPRELPESEYDFYRLSNLDFEMMTQMNLDDGEFFISSSARPFQMGDSSQFFPGGQGIADDFLVEFQPCAADTEGLVIPSPDQIRLDETVNGKLREVKKVEDKKDPERQKPSDLFIMAEPLSEDMSSAEVSPTLGELRHTRERLKLDLCRSARSDRGEASVLDSGGEDSGVGSSDRLDQVQSSEV